MIPEEDRAGYFQTSSQRSANSTTTTSKIIEKNTMGYVQMGSFDINGTTRTIGTADIPTCHI
jgi:hypothetical protein